MPMKYLILLLVFAFVFAGLGFAQSPAKAGAFTYQSGIALQNLADATANITIHYYNQDGSEDPNSPVTDTIPALGSKTYFPIPTDTGFNGSVVVESDVQIASISNIVGNNFQAVASYDGASSGGSPVNLPLLMKNNSGYSTWFNVQNAGAGDANVSVAYSDGTSASFVIPQGAAHTFDQALESHPAAIFSGVVTSDQPVAATVVEENTGIMFAFSGFATSTTSPVFPLVNENNSGIVTGIQIQNVGTQATDVTVSYTHSLAGTDCTETQTIPAGESKTFALFAFNSGANSTCVAHAPFIGSGKVTANSNGQMLNAIANQLKPGVNGGSYGAFSPTDATDTTVLPLVMNANSGYWTGFAVANVGSAATTVTCTFTPYGGLTLPTPSATLQPGESATWLTASGALFGTNLYIGAATCNAPGGEIVSIANILGPNQTNKDQLSVYEGFNTTP